MMEDFTNSAMADMNLMYGVANWKGRETLQLHQERFPKGVFQTTKYLRGCIGTFVKMGHSSPSLKKGLDQELYDIQTYIKAS